MIPREDEEVALGHGVEVHDSDDVLILVCRACLFAPVGDVTQQAPAAARTKEGAEAALMDHIGMQTR